jgi:hypothetical protein
LSCEVITSPSTCVGGGFPLPDYWSVILGATLIILFLLLAYSWRNVPYLPAVPLAVLPVIALPEAMVYNLSLLTLVVGIIFISFTRLPELEIPARSRRIIAWFLGGSLLSLLVLPIRFDHWFGSPFSSILVPGLFSIISVLVAVHLIGDLRLSGRGAHKGLWATKWIVDSSWIRRIRKDQTHEDA